MLAKSYSDRREVVARRAVFKHMASCAEGVLGHCTEMTEFRPVLARALRGRDQAVFGNSFSLLMRACPTIAPVAANHHAGETRFYGHNREDQRKDLARAAVVETCAEVY